MKGKKLFILIILLLILGVGAMAYLEIGFFKPIEKTKYTTDDAISFGDLARAGNTPNPFIENPDIIVGTVQDTPDISLTDVLIPLVEHQAAEENVIFNQCLSCEFNEENPDICSNYECSPFGVQTNQLNYFFCDNPYVEGWDPNNLTIPEFPSTILSNLGGASNNQYYNIYRKLDKYKKDLVRANTNCDDMLDKDKNQTVVRSFIDSLPATLQTLLEAGRADNTIIPETDNCIEDYILNNRYIQHINPGFKGFRDMFKEQLDQHENSYSSEEVDKIYATCFGIKTAPSPEEVVCPADGLGLTTPVPIVPIQTPSIKYGQLDSKCNQNKVINEKDGCKTAFQELSNQNIDPIEKTDTNFPRGCSLVSGSDLIFNNVLYRSGSPQPSTAPLCRR